MMKWTEYKNTAVQEEWRNSHCHSGLRRTTSEMMGSSLTDAKNGPGKFEEKLDICLISNISPKILIKDIYKLRNTKLHSGETQQTPP